jgi:hypothetical protein
MTIQSVSSTFAGTPRLRRAVLAAPFLALPFLVHPHPAQANPCPQVTTQPQISLDRYAPLMILGGLLAFIGITGYIRR